MTIRISHVSTASALALTLLAGTSAVASAQQGTKADSRWQPWVGCWQPVASADAAIGAAQAPVVCIAPTSNPSAVELATIQKGAVTSRDTIDASGTARAIDKQGCAGTETAQWSADDRRVYLHSDVTCTGGVKRTGNGLVAMSPTGEWLDIQSVGAGNNESVRAVHYRDASALRDSLPAEFRSLISDQAMAVDAARTAAGSALNVADIADAVAKLDTTVVEAWIVERGVKFQLGAQQLVALADAGVPGSVTDVMVGVSYPQHFAMMPREMSANGYPSTARDSARMVSDYLRDRCFGTALWSTSIFDDPCAFAYGYSPYGAYGMGYYGYGYGYSPYGYGYSPYGYGYGSPYYATGGYYVPVFTPRGNGNSSGATTEHGRVINGRGYTRGGSSSGSANTGGSTARSGDSGSSSGSSAGSTRTAPASSSSGASSSSSGRTAHPRPPM